MLLECPILFYYLSHQNVIVMVATCLAVLFWRAKIYVAPFKKEIHAKKIIGVEGFGRNCEKLFLLRFP